MAFISAPGPLELMVILVIALIVLGPKRLPEAARSVGHGLRELRDSMQAPSPYGDDDRGRELDDPYDEDDDDPYRDDRDDEAHTRDRGDEEPEPHAEGDEPVAAPRRGTPDHS